MTEESEDLVPCPVCNKPIKHNSKFCKYCGTPLRICNKCNALNERNALYCRQCGEKLSPLESEAVSESSLPTPPIDSFPAPSEQIIFQAPTYPPYYPRPHQQFEIFNKKSIDTYSPDMTIHPYRKVKFLGYLAGPIPSSNVFSFSLEAFAYSLLYIAIGTVITSIGLAFVGTIILPIIGGLIGATFIISAPFFGIYLVSSTWLYKAFKIKRPTPISIIVWNYFLGNLFLSIIALFLTPIYLQVSAATYALSIVGFIIYTLLFVVVPLKAFLADLLYVKAAVHERDNQLKKESNSIEIEKIDQNEEKTVEEPQDTIEN